jgi:hypothetical protein
MHRIDAVRATGRTAELTAGHDGRIVSDIVAEWARRHGRPFVAELTGPAGGTYASGPGRASAERIGLDAVEFCRTLAGRAPATGLLTTIVPFLGVAGCRNLPEPSGHRVPARPTGVPRRPLASRAAR